MSDVKKLIPEYTSEEAKSWLDGMSANVRTTADLVLILLTGLGFVLFTMGVMRYMRAARDAATGGGGGDGYREALWMIVIGTLFAVIGGIYIFFVAIGRSAVT